MLNHQFIFFTAFLITSATLKKLLTCMYKYAQAIFSIKKINLNF